MNKLLFTYAHKEMIDIWCEDNRFTIWEKLWLSLAEAMVEINDDLVVQEQATFLRRNIGCHRTHAEKSRIAEYKIRYNNDYRALIEFMAYLCPSNRHIIGLGASQQDILENAELVILKKSVDLIIKNLYKTIDALAYTCESYKADPSYFHLKLTTIGKRLCTPLDDLVNDLMELEIINIPFRGIKNNGTQENLLYLLKEPELIWKLESLVASKMDFETIMPICGLEYSRRVENRVISLLSSIAQNIYKFATQVSRIKEIIVSELDDVCSLAKYVVNESHNMEFSGDREIYLPNMFFATDALLRETKKVIESIVLNEDDVTLRRNMQFVVMDRVLDEAVKIGGDRKTLKETMIGLIKNAELAIKSGRPNNLWSELNGWEIFRKALPKVDMTPKSYIGMAEIQTDTYIRDVVVPLRDKYKRFK